MTRVERLFVNLAPCTNPSCPLCVDNGLLKGGELFAVGEHWYVYVFRNEDSSFERAMINPKQHYEHVGLMPMGSGDEYNALYGQLREAFGLGKVPYNEYLNDGYAAGQRIKGHLHRHIEPRDSEATSSGMGTTLLVRTYDSLVADILALAAECIDPEMATKLRGLASKYVVKP